MLEQNLTIKSCPFCGSDNVGPGYKQHPNNHIIAMISCAECGACGPAINMPQTTSGMQTADNNALHAWESRV